jgi:hypothetical protein
MRRLLSIFLWEAPAGATPPPPAPPVTTTGSSGLTPTYKVLFPERERKHERVPHPSERRAGGGRGLGGPVAEGVFNDEGEWLDRRLGRSLRTDTNLIIFLIAADDDD